MNRPRLQGVLYLVFLATLFHVFFSAVTTRNLARELRLEAQACYKQELRAVYVQVGDAYRLECRP